MSEPKRFGAFFRDRRKSLRLTLREFCRQYGFDAGNISRLERGLLKPPQSNDLLTSYANALRLEPDSPDWLKLFNLAAAETGRVPSEIIKDERASAKLPEVFSSLRRERRREGTWTSAIDLDSWADILDARSQLPRLIRRLVHATTAVERIEFPAGEGVQRTGWDGLIDTKAGNAFVPFGVSAWELGVDRKVANKAEEEFVKRTKQPLGITPPEATFVFVTARKWLKKREWCYAKKELGLWQDVRAYDAADIEEWLETAPPVDAWFANLLGRKPDGVTDIDDYWADLTSLAKPNLKPEVFLSSRQEEIKWLENWLSEPPSSLAVAARSPAEVLDFLAAYIASLEEDKREAIASRILIVEREEAWSSLSSGNHRLVLVAKPGLQIEAEMAARAVRNGHHVLLSSHRFSSERTSKRELPRCYRHDLEKALIASGFSDQEAAQHARESGGSLTVLKRRLARFPSTKVPEWSQSENASELAPLILIGAWHDGNEADCRIVERVTGRKYGEVLTLANRWSNTDDAPLMRILSQWSVISREDSWVMVGHHITRQQLDTFEEAAIEVLAEDDPKLDLARSERSFSHFHGKTLSHSVTLRTGLAETLGLLGSRPEYVEQGGTSRADRVVRELLSGEKSWKRWASLSRDLPVLAEAAPGAFLDAVRADINGSDPQLPRLFEDDEPPLFSSCIHAGLLWALEGLAWCPDYLSEVTYLLARLHEHDKGGTWSNRPFNSLVEIFLPWLPQTTVSVDGRIKVLRRLTERADKVGWKLLLRLLPSWHGTSTPTHRPAWRPWVMDWSQGVTNAEYWEQVNACAIRLSEMVGESSSRWVDVVENIEHFPAPQQIELIERLTTLDVDKFSVPEQKQLTDKIRKKAHRHRAYADKEWALNAQIVDQLESAGVRLEPKDLVARNSWLFAQWPRSLDEWDDLTTKERDERLSKVRQEALQEILVDGALPKVLELAKASESPYSVGLELARLDGSKYDADVLPELLISNEEVISSFARGYTRARFNDEQWGLVELLLVGQWTGEQIVALGQALPFERRTWEWIERHGENVVTQYWRKCQVWIEAKDDLRYVISNLLKFGRPFSAVSALTMAIHKKDLVDVDLFMSTLEGTLRPQQEIHEEVNQDIAHDIQELFEALQKQADLPDRNRLASLEWAYLSILDGHGAYPTTLLGLIQSEPDFFVSVLREVFRSENESGDDTRVPTEEARNRAQQAYKLLMNWETVPGTSADGNTVDEEYLLAWIRKAREMAQQSGHLKVCDSQIGQVFAYAPAEDDESWPCVPVRDAIEEIDTSETQSGFITGILNKRGVYHKSPFEGGTQERDLAAKYSKYATVCQQEWPRVASALTSVARHYEEDAKREDARAEARK